MNILVTGGAGFIGSHFLLRHVQQQPADSVVVLDALTYAADKTFLDPIKDAITFVRGDIGDFALVTKLVEEHAIDTIVNFAAESHVDNSIVDSAPFLRTNILGVQNLIEVIKAHPTIRFLHISTDEVYGDIEDSDPPRTVGDALWPSSPYAASKAAAEMLVMAAIRTYGIHAAVTRCTNNYGPHQAAEKFIPTVIRHALLGQPVPIYAEGKNKRDWLYVTDHCDALEMILKTQRPLSLDTISRSEITRDDTRGKNFFNIAAGNEWQNIDVAKKILEILGKPESLLTFVADRKGHDWRYCIDSVAIRTLGWKPQVAFDEGLARTIDWYRSRV